MESFNLILQQNVSVLFCLVFRNNSKFVAVVNRKCNDIHCSLTQVPPVSTFVLPRVSLLHLQLHWLITTSSPHGLYQNPSWCHPCWVSTHLWWNVPIHRVSQSSLTLRNCLLSICSLVHLKYLSQNCIHAELQTRLPFSECSPAFEEIQLNP